MRGEEEIREWLVRRVAELVELAPGDIDTSLVIDNYGIDSLQATTLSGELEEWLGTELPPTVVWDYPTIDLLAAHLSGGAEPRASPPG